MTLAPLRLSGGGLDMPELGKRSAHERDTVSDSDDDLCGLDLDAIEASIAPASARSAPTRAPEELFLFPRRHNTAQSPQAKRSSFQ